MNKLTSQGMIYNLKSMRGFAANFIGNGGNYDELLKAIIESDSTLTPKILAKQLNITVDKCRFQIRKLYNDIIENKEGVTFKFNKSKVYLNFKHRDIFHFIEVEKLPIMPRVGEQIEVPFLMEYFDNHIFYIDSIHHKLENDFQVIDIHLTGGYYNLFWHWRRDKAYLTNEFPSSILYGGDELKLQKAMGL